MIGSPAQTRCPRADVSGLGLVSPVKYKFRTKPYRHQIDGIKKAFAQFNRGLGVALLFSPRTGKTKTAIDIAGMLSMKKNLRKVVVICPNRVIGTWVQEFALHSPLVIQTIMWDAKARKEPIPQPPSAYDLQVVIVNYEAFAVPGHRTPSGARSKADGRFKYRKMLQDWIGGDEALLIVDESHRLKNPSGKASNLILTLRSLFYPHVILMTGTPITKAKRAADIYMQWQMINPDRFPWGSTYEDFRRHTGVWSSNGPGGVPIWRRERPEGMGDLQKGLHADGIVVTREECFDLPAALPDRIIDVPLSRATAKHYDEMAREMVTLLEDGNMAEASIPLVATLRLSQITSGFVGVMEPHPRNPDKQVSRPVRVGTEKIDVLRKLLAEETVEEDEPVIIVARWKADIRAAQNVCEDLGIPAYTIAGGMSRSDTDDALRLFKRHTDTAAAMIVQPAAGGVGLDMRTAGHMIWMSLTPSWVDYTQMKDRNALHSRAVRFTYLMVPDTVDHLLYQVLQHDGDVSRAILRRPEALLRRAR